MNNVQKIALVVGLVIAVGAVIALKNKQQAPGPQPHEAVAQTTTSAPSAASDNAEIGTKLPALIDLGASKCMPCKMMEPILEDLRHNYADKFTTTFYDVWKDPEPAKKYRIQSIPTQIFLDPDGKELNRHVGFMSKEDILATWKRLGYPMNAQ